MALQHTFNFPNSFRPIQDYHPKDFHAFPRSKLSCPWVSNLFNFHLQGGGFRSSPLTASQRGERIRSHYVKNKQSAESSDSDEEDDARAERTGKVNDPYLMDAAERREWRRKIKEVIDKYPEAEEEQLDPEQKRIKMQKLLADYPLVVDEDDPNWPEEDADGWGFNLSQFFNKITIKNVKKEDDENYDSDREIEWQDDNYIRPIKDITTAEWEEATFKDISPLIVLVHNRYKSPKANEKIRDALEKAVHIIWNCSLPSPRCVAVDAVVETDLVSALKVSVFPEIIFTKSGKILFRDRAIRTPDEFSKIMAYFYYGAAKPPCLSLSSMEESQELIPSVPFSGQ